MISSIKEGEATWNSSFDYYDMMCPAPSPTLKASQTIRVLKVGVYSVRSSTVRSSNVENVA